MKKKCLEKVPEGRKAYFGSKIGRGGSLLAGKARLQNMEWLFLPLQWSGSGESKWESLELEALRPSP